MIDISGLNARISAELGKRIQQDIAREFEIFGAGKWINPTDAGATGMQAVLIQAKIAGLHAAMIHLQETDRLLTGKIADKKEKAA